MVHGDGQVYAAQFDIIHQRIDAHRFVVVGQNCDDIVPAVARHSRELVYGYRVDNVFANLLELHAVRTAEHGRMGRAVVEVERQRGVYVRIVDGREAGDLDGSKVAVVCTPHADVAVARGGAAGIEGQCRDVGLCLGGRVQAVDVAAARIVDEVLLRGADEVAELVVSAPVSTATPRQGQGLAGSPDAHAIGMLVG